MADNQLTFKAFLFNTLYFPSHVLRAMRIYLTINFIIALIMGAYTMYMSNVFLVSVLFYFIFMLTLMPIIIYIGVCCRRVVEKYKSHGKAQPKVTYWLFSRFILHLAIMIILYLWIASILLSSLLIYIG